MAEGSGIYRTASGRETYHPDGFERNGSSNAQTFTTQTFTTQTSTTQSSTARQQSAHTVSTDSHELSSAETPQNEIYITEDGKEAAEEPQENEDLRQGSIASRAFEPINPGDEGILTRLATQMSRPSMSRRNTNSTATGDDLERKHTLDGVEIGDPVLDPSSPEFDLRTYIKMVMSLLDREGIKIKRAGLSFKDVNVSGKGSALNVQGNVGSMFTAPLHIKEHIGRKPEKRILRNFSGLLKQGELLVVLGRPGSGCSTFLKTLTGEMHGLNVDEKSVIHYNGIPQKKMMQEFKGEVIYNQEVDKHFPHLTVGETLEHAAALRVPSHRAMGVSRQELVKHITQVTMAIYGLSHTYNTKVGDDFVRGVSGGERKRVSIAEMALAGSPVSAWDNSTRGLDSATALTFTKALRLSSDILGSY
nr:abc transporter cdr4 [Quercus suber]